jgi:hypothetical protein
MKTLGKIVLGCVMLLVASSNCWSATMGAGSLWQEYETDNYGCNINNTGCVEIYFDKKTNIFPSLARLFYYGGDNFYQHESGKIETIEGKIKDIQENKAKKIQEGRSFIIEAKLTQGTDFLQTITCASNTIIVKYNIVPRNMTQQPMIYPVYSDQMCFPEGTNVKYKIKGENEIKEIKKGEIIRTYFENPTVEWIEIEKYYDRKIKIEILEGKTGINYKGSMKSFTLQLCGLKEGEEEVMSVKYTIDKIK